MKKTLTLTVLSSALLFSTQSFATTFVNIDDFNSGDQSVADTTVGGGGDTSTNAIRSLAIELLAAAPPVQSGSTVSFGVLDVTNGTGEDSEVTAAWNLAAGLLPANANNIGFFFSIVASDGNPTALDFAFNSNPLASFSIAPNTTNQNVSFGLTPAQIALVSAGGPLSLTINGAPGWDLTVDAFGFSYDQPTTTPSNGNVPEPAAFALIAAGLAGLGFRKKKQG